MIWPEAAALEGAPRGVKGSTASKNSGQVEEHALGESGLKRREIGKGLAHARLAAAECPGVGEEERSEKFRPHSAVPARVLEGVAGEEFPGAGVFGRQAEESVGGEERVFHLIEKHLPAAAHEDGVRERDAPEAHRAGREVGGFADGVDGHMTGAVPHPFVERLLHGPRGRGPAASAVVIAVVG